MSIAPRPLGRLILAFAACPALAASQPAFAEHPESALLETVLESPVRAEDKARDEFRHPAETLAFFRIEPDQTLVEYAPGGGWYTRILAPYVAPHGRYIAMSFSPEGGIPERMRSNLAGWTESFPEKAAEYSGVPAERISAYFTGQTPEELNGTVDRILIVRMLHNMKRWGIADSELTAMRRLLADDGLIGIVQHRAPEGMTYDRADGNEGYLPQSDVVALMDAYGFELVGESEINANPADDGDHPAGVWTLPPSYARGDEKRAEYEAIGESDRMTLLFRKAP